jgi:hypothetical protein
MTDNCFEVKKKLSCYWNYLQVDTLLFPNVVNLTLMKEEKGTGYDAPEGDFSTL